MALIAWNYMGEKSLQFSLIMALLSEEDIIVEEYFTDEEEIGGVEPRLLNFFFMTLSSLHRFHDKKFF